MKRYLFPIFWILAAIIIVVGSSIAAIDDANGIISLEALSPLVSLISIQGRRFSVHGHPLFLYATTGLSLTLLLIGFRIHECRQNCFVIGCISAIVAQLFLVDQELCRSVAELFGFSTDPRNIFVIATSVGAGGYTLAAVFLFFALKQKSAPDIIHRERNFKSDFSLSDLFVLLAVFFGAAILRLYALNQILNYFEGELSGYSAGATSLKGMFLANKGVGGPWAPLGILYYFPIYLTTRLFGTTLVALRLSSAWVGLLSIPLVYMLARRLAGKTAGHVAAMLFSLDCLHIGWSRTDIHPHGVTTWPTLLLCYFLLRAFDTRKSKWAFAAAFMMGLSWHQYPSGQSAVVIPLLAAGFFLLNNRLRMPLSWNHALILCVGLALWAVGLPLSYYFADGDWWGFQNPFNLTGPRALWGCEGCAGAASVSVFVLGEAAIHIGDVLLGIFYQVPYSFHQEWMFPSHGFSMRTVAWLVVPLAFVGMSIFIASRKRFESAVVFAWVVAAVLPGILSEHAYAKRLSTLFPAIDILAGVGVAGIVAILGNGRGQWRKFIAYFAITIVSICFFAFSIYTWFSGEIIKYGEPDVVSMASSVSKSIDPGAIVIADVEGYNSARLGYLLLDHLSDEGNRPNMLALPPHESIMSMIESPLSAGAYITNRWLYLWTRLRDQQKETQRFMSEASYDLQACRSREHWTFDTSTDYLEQVACIDESVYPTASCDESFNCEWPVCDRPSGEWTRTCEEYRSGWLKVVFVFQNYHHNAAINAASIKAASERCANPAIYQVDSSQNTDEWKLFSLQVISCKLHDLK